MRTKLFLLLAGAALLASCSSHQYVSYTLKNADKHGTVNQQAFSVDYDNFTLSYTANGGCTLRNNSDSMMIVDLGSSYFVTDDGNSTCIYSSKVVSTTNTNSTTRTRAFSDSDIIHGRHYSNAVTYAGARSNTSTTSTTTVEQEERYICIPPHASSNLKFFSLQAPSPYIPGTKSFIDKEQTYDESSFNPCVHVLNYGYGSNKDTKYQMARNEFYISWQSVSKDEQAVSGRNVQHNDVTDKKQTILTTVGLSVGLAAIIVAAALVGASSSSVRIY